MWFHMRLKALGLVSLITGTAILTLFEWGIPQAQVIFNAEIYAIKHCMTKNQKRWTLYDSTGPKK